MTTSLSIKGTAALQLAQKGFSVFPAYEIDPNGRCACGKDDCHSPGKHPRTRKGVKEATRDIERISKWWEAWPTANIGLATGSISGVFAVDVDTKNHGLEALERLNKKIGGFPETMMALTGGRGLHFLYRLPPGVLIRNSTSSLAPGIDIRGEGGYIIAPPSNHASGNEYEWFNDLAIPAAPSEWLIAFCSGRAGAVNAPATVLAGSGNIFAEGRRNTDMTRIAGLLRRSGGDSSEIQSILSAINGTLAKPLEQSELEGIANGIVRYDPAPCTDLSELGVSEYLVNSFGGLFKYTPATHWMAYGQGLWDRDPDGLKTQEWTKRAINELSERLMATAKTPEERVEITKTCAKYRRNSFVRSIQALAMSSPQVHIDISDFDSDSDLFNVENGTLRLSTQEFLGHDPAHLLTQMAAVKYDPAAECPVFDRFLGEVLEPDVAAFVLRFLAYSMMGKPDQQQMMVMHGVGRNGKSTLLNCVEKLLGSYAQSADPSTLLNRKEGSATNDLSRLKSARLVITSELANGAVMDAALVKKLTGGDPIVARLLYKEHFEFRPQFVIVMATNHTPVFEGSDFAMARRLLLVPFSKIVPEASVDPMLPEKLLAERSGILNRLLKSLKEYRDQGLNPPQSVLRATEQYVAESNLLEQFLVDRCERGADKSVSASVLHSMYVSWCIGQSVKPMSQPVFKRTLEQALGIKARRERSGVIWPGLGIRY